MRIKWFFIWKQNLNALHTRMLCAKFGWNWPSNSWEVDFWKFVNVFSLFRNYHPLEKGWALHLNKLRSPSSKDVLCQVWMKLVQLFLSRFFFNVVNVFLLLHNYLPLERAGPFIWTDLGPLHPRMFCVKFGGSWEEDF